MKKERLDIYMSRLKKEFSRSACQRFICDFGVQINGKKITSAHSSVSEGDEVSFSENDWEAFVDSRSGQKHGDPNAKMVFSDEMIVSDEKGEYFVLDKPAGITTEEIVNGFWPVHRLDKDTSGILVVAQNQKAQADLQAQWQKRKVLKTYVALLKGHLTPGKGTIDAGIERSLKDRKKMAVSALHSARKSITDYEVTEYFSAKFGKDVIPCTLIKAFPKTGRTHQIRVHFSSIGHPVVGDKHYGDRKMNEIWARETGLGRQFLHAAEINLENPKTKESVRYKSELPEDLAKVIRILESSRDPVRLAKS